ncbi:MAG: hypothetical protein KGQ54_05420, partial [Verrucomicrobia bacterium]|nr:hypothetical protein [Verrucomicrobiota bacterium]
MCRMSKSTDNLTLEVKKTLMASLDAKGIKHNICIDEVAPNEPVMGLEAMLKPKFDEKFLVQTKTSLPVTAQLLLDRAENLHQAHTQYEQEYILKGRDVSYKLLEDMHGLATQIKTSPDAEAILKMMRDFLKEKYDIKLNKSSTAMGTLVRYVIRADKLTASRYGKVLKVAQEEGIKPENFIAFVKGRGGISKITTTQAEKVIQDDLKRTQAARMDFASEICSVMAMVSKTDIEYTRGITVHRQDKLAKSDGSRFVYFMAAHLGGNQYRLIQAHDFDRAFEDQILAQIAKPLPSDLGVIERSIRSYIKDILKGEGLSKG